MTRSLTVLPAHCERRVIDAIAWPQSVRLASWPTVRFATTAVTTVAPLTTIATTQKRAGGHRLFTANYPEPTGVARLPSGVRDSQSGCRTMRNRQ
jgi:hypothetical protein